MSGHNSNGMPVFWLICRGHTVSRLTGRATSAPGGLCGVQHFERMEDALHVVRLIQIGELAPEEVFSYKFPGESAGDRVETVADIHRGLRRRR